jgi:hypothetical protein
MNRQEAQGIVEKAAQTFMEVDRYLLEMDLMERCIAARFAMHLQGRIHEYSVDVEYNRAGASPKTLQLADECANRRDEFGNSLVIPDIIIHRRGPGGPNLMAIEMKKEHNAIGQQCDRLRVRAFREQLHYRYGVLMECTTGENNPSIRIAEWLGE